jgi:hypothetical protein
MTHKEFFSTTDYDLLRAQKLTLLLLLDSRKLLPTLKDDIQGLVHFIDAFQDTAVDNGIDEDTVFGEI